MPRTASHLAFLLAVAFATTVAAQDSAPSADRFSPPAPRRLALIRTGAESRATGRIEVDLRPHDVVYAWVEAEGFAPSLEAREKGGATLLRDEDSGGRGVPFVKVVGDDAPVALELVVYGPTDRDVEVDVRLRVVARDEAWRAAYAAFVARFNALRAPGPVRRSESRRAAEATSLVSDVLRSPLLGEDHGLVVLLGSTAVLVADDAAAARAFEAAEAARLAFAPRAHTLRMQLPAQRALRLINRKDFVGAVEILRAALSAAEDRGADDLEHLFAELLLARHALKARPGPDGIKESIDAARRAVAYVDAGRERRHDLTRAAYEALMHALLAEGRGDACLTAAQEYRRAMAERAPGDPFSEAGALAAIASALMTSRRPKEALEAALQAIALYEAAGDAALFDRDTARLLVVAAGLEGGEPSRVVDQFAQMDRAARDELLRTEPRALGAFALGLMGVDENEQALEALERALEGARGAPDLARAQLEKSALACALALGDQAKLRRLAEAVLAREGPDVAGVRRHAHLALATADWRARDRAGMLAHVAAAAADGDAVTEPSERMAVATAELLGGDYSRAEATANAGIAALGDGPLDDVVRAVFGQTIALAAAARGDATAALRGVDASLRAFTSSGAVSPSSLAALRGASASLGAYVGVPDLAARLDAVADDVARTLRTAPIRRSTRAAAAGLGTARAGLGALAALEPSALRGPASRPAAPRRLFELGESLRAAIGGVSAAQRASGAPARRGVVASLRAKAAAAAARAGFLYGERAPAEKILAALEEKERHEAELIRELATDPAAARRLRPITTDDVAARLRAGDLYVGFARLRTPPPTLAAFVASETEEEYFAWTLDAAATVAVRRLGSAAEIDALVAAWRRDLRASDAATARGVDDPAVDGAVSRPAAGAALRAAVVDVLLALDHPAPRRLFVAPDGDLHLVPFDALPLADGRLLGDVLDVVVMDSAHDLDPPEDAAGEAPTAAALVLGGADYGDAAAASRISVASRPARDLASPATVREALLVRDAGPGSAFAPLPGALAEAEAVARLVGEGDASKTVLLTGAGATKSAFLAAAPRAAMIHLATHGWYAPDGLSAASGGAAPSATAVVGGSTVTGYSPYLLCGLAFAGANALDPSKRSRAILTAEELAALDLRTCRLAVLSACQTGAGRARESGDLASLKSALHAAGVRRTLTSLWPVPDASTAALMTEFYGRLRSRGEPPGRALAGAKRALREARDAETGRPRFGTVDWAGWILTGPPDD